MFDIIEICILNYAENVHCKDVANYVLWNKFYYNVKKIMFLLSQVLRLIIFL